MKIALAACHVDPAEPRHPQLADQAAHLRGLGRALAAGGHHVTIFARRESAAGPDELRLGRDLTVRYLTAGPAAPAAPQDLPSHAGAFGAGLAGWLGQMAPDIIHAYHWTSGLAALAAAREHHVPVVVSFGSLAVTERRCGLTGQDQALRMRMEACVGRGAAGVLAASTQEAGDLTRLGIAGAAVRVVPFGFDPAEFGLGKTARRLSGPVRLLCLDPLDQHHRVDCLVRAVAVLPQTELVIAADPGLAPRGRDRAVRQLGKLAAELGVADRVTFTGQPGEGELRPVLDRADLLVSAVRHEPLGRAVISAMACGLPAVATAAGAHSDVITDGISGLLVPPARPEMIGKRLHELLATPMRVTALGIGAADRAASRYEWSRIAREAQAAYQHVLSRQAPGAECGRKRAGGPDYSAGAACSSAGKRAA